MHIELWPSNRDKALNMKKALGTPNTFLNEFFDRVDQTNFIENLQKALREDHSKIKIVVESMGINDYMSNLVRV